MSQDKGPSNPTPPKWARVLYRFLAAGRYAMLWLPELLILYGDILAEDGEEKAKDWLIEELKLTVKPSVALRLYRLLRIVFLAWETYKRTVRD